MFPKENSSNGYHTPPPPPPPPGVGNINSHRERARRGTRRSRASRDSISLRVYDQQQQQQQQQQRAPCTDFDMAYFHSYAHLGIHEEMIKDRVRTETYREAIMRHQSFIAGKVVVDVGCGTGILAIFCAQAGAKRVYAVDASDIALQANEVVKANNLSDVIVVLHGRVEDVEINEQSMLGSVITARDRWLKPGGLILPSNATLYMAPVTHCDRYSGSIDFWRNVYGIDMSAMLSLAKQCAFEEPSVETITGENILTWPHVVKYIDCYSVTIGELETVTTRFKFNSMMRAPLHGFAFWFDVEFNGPAMPQSNYPSSTSFTDNHLVNGSQRKKRINPNEALVLSTAPEDPPTHWQQTLIYFYDPIELEQDQVIEGLVTLTQSKENARFMNIHLEYTSGGRSHIKESVMR
ncbi:probable protein arginine N-methyltransferase 6 isoform X2 [Arachis stenosperma]|uniref:probable protein arginine N-methyltransferase 6 isoform X2 n=1 Tax=Arachis stenosperma TaxID=217475 RepID=UPI0025ACC4C4|nr:probable protein arginine N-methyltransferase 6 isoform X2 [Arachis stenosperma]